MANELRFGIGGLPLTHKSGVVEGIGYLASLGLQHLELEFVQSVFIKKEKAPEVKEAAEKADVSLSVHGSYYVNLASQDRPKWHAAISRVVQAAEVGAMCGAKSVTYHTGFFQGQTFEQVKPTVLEAMVNIFQDLDKRKAMIKIAPELTGKPSQVGDLNELIELVRTLQDQGFKQSSLCIDFAHKFARTDGKFNTYDEFMGMIEDVNKGLGPEFLEHLHIHMSGIEHTPKGERNHLTYLDSLKEYKDAGVQVEGIEKHWDALPENRKTENKFNWRDLLKALKAANVGGYLVCESPILELDALLMQTYYRGL